MWFVVHVKEAEKKKKPNELDVFPVLGYLKIHNISKVVLYRK